MLLPLVLVTEAIVNGGVEKDCSACPVREHQPAK